MKSPTTTGTAVHHSTGDRLFVFSVYAFLGLLMLGMIVPFINVLAVASHILLCDCQEEPS